MSLFEREMRKPGAGQGIALTEDEASILKWAHRNGVVMPLGAAAELAQRFHGLRAKIPNTADK